MALIAALAWPVPAIAQDCRQPPSSTEFHQPKRFRQSLEAFRIETEQAREAAEHGRLTAAIHRREYREAIARYRENISAYRQGVALARDLPCEFARNEILSLTILPGSLDSQYDLERGNDVVRLRIAYYYTGDYGEEVSMGAITLNAGQSTGHWGYRPHGLQRGVHVAEVNLGMNNEAPDGYRSDEISTDMFVHRKGEFCQRVFPFVHEWRRRKADP